MGWSKIDDIKTKERKIQMMERGRHTIRCERKTNNKQQEMKESGNKR